MLNFATSAFAPAGTPPLKQPSSSVSPQWPHAPRAFAKGFQSCKVNRGIESPERYILQIFWEKLEDHTVAFRQGPLFSEWRTIVGPFAAEPPAVEHFEILS